MNTSELTGPALDWAVAKCMDWPYPVVYDEDGNEVLIAPSTDWAQGGPIIEREKIGLFFDRACGNKWRASHMTAPYQLGPTPLIAAMRCFVAGQMGDEVGVPSDLL